MRVTIVRDDGVVGVDGVFRRIDLSALPPGVRAVQWDGMQGHVEYDDVANTRLDTLSEFQWAVDRWLAAPFPFAPSGAGDGV
ncbi:hypothetical protein [Nitrosovibrio sp. Nv17]|uniref:hypothetical protein n=1 Tax=Nitrosovibrio sp. Nv17 TaxID=1855339 RepID=UPI000908CA30|nr:hypothetical protein [Nitrosovibrio sp. Nv17]SFW21812.1 hypothetical protein SAMN05216414_106109 [Nitrosovibrio sp. Nv17]